jgi:hypothetical protein
MNQFLVVHEAGEFLVRTKLDADAAHDLIVEKWPTIEVTDVLRATAGDIEQNMGQWTELDTDI